ncbi:Maf family protein, partial [Enterococcus faecalis]
QGALLIESIAGDYYSIMGLPIAKVARLLKEFN